MSFLDKFRKSPEEPLESLDASMGGGYMSSLLFNELAFRVKNLNSKIDWTMIYGGSAHGRTQRHITTDYLDCVLRPLQNKNVVGLAFECQVVAVPTVKIVDLIRAAETMSLNMYPVTGSEVSITRFSDSRPAALWFKTLIVKGSDGFTDELLQELLTSNFMLGSLAFKSLVGVHQGKFTVEESVGDFWEPYLNYVRLLKPSIQAAYLESKRQRMSQQ